MSVETWSLIWKIVFFAGVILFGVLVLPVIFGDAEDIGKLIKRLEEEPGSSAGSEPGSEEG